MASHGFIFEASSLVSIFSLVFSIHSKISHFMLPTDISGSHVLSRFYFCSLRVCAVFDHFGYPAPPIGDWRHVKWYNLRSVQQTLEEMQQRITSGLTPLPPLQIASTLGLPVGSTATPGPSASGSHVRPEVARKAPRSKAGKAQLTAALQPRGHGGGSKGIRLEDSLCPAGLSRRSGLMSLTLPTTGVCSTKTRLRTLMTPLSPLMGLSQVLPRPLWPPVPPVPLPRRPSDRWGVFHSVTPPTASSHEQTLYQVTTCFISLV